MSKLAQDKNFRQAIKLGIDRDKLILDNEDKSTAFEILPESSWGRLGFKSSPDSISAQQAVQKISPQFLNKEIPIPIYAATQTNFQDTPQGRIEGQIRKLGIPVVLKFTGSIEEFRNDKSAPFRVTGFAADYLDPLAVFSQFSKNGMYGEAFPQDKLFDTLFDEASQAPSFDVRVETVKKLNSYFIEQGYILPLWQRKTIYFFNKNTVISLGKQRGGPILLINEIQMKSH